MDKFEMEVRRIFPYVSFHPVEREIYSHDISVMPSSIEKMVHNICDVVIQPENLYQVKEILKLSKEYSLPVVPRGSATSGYGGVIPYKGGIMVDFSRMDYFEIDEDSKTVVAEPGAIWWEIQESALKKGLSLRVYPTSAPSSTVGGWIAQGGIGVGSRMFGGISDNIYELKVVDYEGIKTVSKDHLKFYVGMEGTTGLIVKSIVPLMEYREEKPEAVHVDDLNHAITLLKSGTIYSAIFFDEGYIKLLNELKGENIPERETLLMVKFDEGLEATPHAEFLWNERFCPLRLKKKGPSLVISEVLIPLENLSTFYSTLKKSLKGEHAIQIHFSREYANVITMIPSDEREKRYISDWKKALKIVKLGLKHSGRPYSTGIYLSHLSKRVIEEYNEVEKFKKKVDPENLLNPGKIFPMGKLPKIMKIAEMIS
jgi:FAD/FMN-containing dehydrogenase